MEAAINAGATTVNIPDTVGYATPQQITAARSRCSKNRVPNIDKAVISMHCHNDLGLAVANSLAGVENGAGQIECTINGIGERAGNCSLEEVVMALRTRHDYYDCDTRDQHAASGADQPAADLDHRHASAAEQSDRRPQRVRPRSGHSSGWHAEGTLAPTKSCGRKMSASQKTDLVLGKHSGRAALADRAKALGYTLTGEQLHSVFDEFKKLADKKKEVYDGDIVALIEQQIARRHAAGGMVAGHLRSDAAAPATKPHVKLTLRRGEREHTAELSDGDGPIDCGVSRDGTDHRDQAEMRGLSGSHRHARPRCAGGSESGSRTTKAQTFRGRGVSTDTVEATIQAILFAVNRIEETRG